MTGNILNSTPNSTLLTALKDDLEQASDLVLLTSSELQKRLHLSESSVYKIVRNAASQLYPLDRFATSALILLQRDTNLLTTGDKSIDKILGGGIIASGITEIVGESGSGKTQLCLQLCLTTQLPHHLGGLDGGVVYLHTEGHFPVGRLSQLSRFFPKFFPSLNILSTNLLSNIHIINLADIETQYHVIAYHLPAFLYHHKEIRLVVIDSIAALYRTRQLDNGLSGKIEERKQLCDIGARLKSLCSRFQVAVVCTNQVTDNFGESTAEGFNLPEVDFIFADSLAKKPALGLTWSNTINARIRLARARIATNTIGFANQSTSRRWICVEFAPHTEYRGVEYCVDETGVHSVDK